MGRKLAKSASDLKFSGKKKRATHLSQGAKETTQRDPADPPKKLRADVEPADNWEATGAGPVAQVLAAYTIIDSKASHPSTHCQRGGIFFFEKKIG